MFAANQQRDEVLSALHIDEKQFDTIIRELSPTQKEKLNYMMSCLQFTIKILKKNNQFTPDAIFNWGNIFFHTELTDRDKLKRLLTPYFQPDESIKTTDTLTHIYLAMNAIGLFLTLATFTHLNLGAAVSMTENPALSYINALSGIALGIHQIHQGETTLGIVNILNSMQLGVCAILAHVAYYVPALQFSGAAISGLMGISLAACMLINCFIEIMAIKKYDHQILILNQEIASIRRQLAIDLDKYQENKQKKDECQRRAIEEINLLERMILVETAHRKNHLRNLHSWSSYSMAMLAIGIASYVTLSGITCGMLPAALLVTTTAAIMIGFLRKWSANHDYVKETVTSLSKIHRFTFSQIDLDESSEKRSSDWSKVCFPDHKIYDEDPDIQLTLPKRYNKAS